MNETPNWKLIDEATRLLASRGLTPFTRDDVYREIWKQHPDRPRGSLDPTLQGMVRNAPGGPPSAGGTPLRRLERGLYERAAESTPTPPEPGRVAALASSEEPASAGRPVLSPEAPPPAATGVPWDAVWSGTARRLRAHVEAGRLHLLTEDAVRLCTALALEDAGVAPMQMTVEVPDPAIAGGKLDLVVTTDATSRAVIELKFPRDARGPISPDTMTLGELLRDFHRVARVAAQDRWVVQVINSRLMRYLERVAERHPLVWVSETGRRFVISGDAVSSLPKTALDALGPWRRDVTVEADCRFAESVSDGLRLVAYEVTPLDVVVS